MIIEFYCYKLINFIFKVNDDGVAWVSVQLALSLVSGVALEIFCSHYKTLKN